MVTKPLPEVGQLWAMYTDVGSVHRLADKLGVSHSRIHRSLVAAGYRLKGSKYTAGEDELIRRYYLDTPPDLFSLPELTALLQRPCAANVCRRARQLGLSDKDRPKSAATKKNMSANSREAIKKNGHPRGMLGKKHTEKTLAIISRTSTERWASMTEERRELRNARMIKSRIANGTLANPRPKATWKAGWRKVGGKRCYFRSRWEVNYASYLQWLVGLGQIASWEYEADTFWFDGVKRGTRSYLPDFKVTENNGEIVYHEVKGWMDARSITKIKRMAKYHPKVKLIVIDSSAYRALAKKAKYLVPGWE